METYQNPSGTSRRKLFISVIIALLLINSVTLYFLFSENHEKMDVTSQKMALQSDFKSLSDTLDAKNMIIDQYAGKNAELDKAIAEKEDMLTKEKHQIAGLLSKNKMTATELAQAKGMIAQYEASITDLQGKVDELSKENQQLSQQNQSLSTDLTSEKQATAQLTEQNQGLSKKVEVGSLLPVSNVDVEAIKVRNNGKEVEVHRAKAAESLRVSFETGTNKVLDPGMVSIYMRVVDPKGETIAVADQGSGTLQSAQSPEPIQYSKKADIDWNQTNKKVILYWNQNIKDPGIYKVQLYQNGYEIAKGEVKLS